MPGKVQERVKPRIYTTRRGLDAVKFKGRPASTYDAPPDNEGFTPHVNTDVIQANLSPGEYVLPNWLVQDIQAGRPPFPGPTPSYMHGGGVDDVPGYQHGGRPRLPRSAPGNVVKPSQLRPVRTLASSNPSGVSASGRSTGTGAGVRQSPNPAGVPGSAPGRSRPSRAAAPAPTSVVPGDVDDAAARIGSWRRTAIAPSGAGTRVHTRRAMQKKLELPYSDSGLWRSRSRSQVAASGRDRDDRYDDLERGYEQREQAAKQAGYDSVEDQQRAEDWRDEQHRLAQTRQDVSAKTEEEQERGARTETIGRNTQEIQPLFGPTGSRSDTGIQTQVSGLGGASAVQPTLELAGPSLEGVQAAEGTRSAADEFDFEGEAPGVAYTDRPDPFPSEIVEMMNDAFANVGDSEEPGSEKDARADTLIREAQSEAVPQYSEEDYAMEEAEIDKASRKAMGDALRMAGEQASAMGMPVGAAQGIQAQVTADVSAKAALAKAHRFAQMRVQNMSNLMQQYDNKYKSLLFAAGMERDRAKQDQLYAQAIDMQRRGKNIQKELMDYQDMLNTPTFWEGALQIIGGVGGVLTGGLLTKLLK